MNGKMVYIWRAVDDEGTVLDIVVQSRKNTKAAKRLLYKLLKNHGVMPERIVTDKLESYGAALKKRKLKHLRDVGGRKNNRAENSHLPSRRRERKAQRFKSIKSAQRLLSIYGPLYNLFNHRRHLISRNTLREFRTIAQSEWNVVTAPAMG
jgi:transposase-like protein